MAFATIACRRPRQTHFFGHWCCSAASRRGIKAFHCLHQHHATEPRREHSAHHFPAFGRRTHQRCRHWRHVKRTTGRCDLKQPDRKQIHELRACPGAALAKRRLGRARPQAGPVGRRQYNTTLWSRYPPDFPQIGSRITRFLDPMQHDHTIKHAVRKGQSNIAYGDRRIAATERVP